MIRYAHMNEVARAAGNHVMDLSVVEQRRALCVLCGCEFGDFGKFSEYLKRPCPNNPVHAGQSLGLRAPRRTKHVQTSSKQIEIQAAKLESRRKQTALDILKRPARSGDPEAPI